MLCQHICILILTLKPQLEVNSNQLWNISCIPLHPIASSLIFVASSIVCLHVHLKCNPPASEWLHIQLHFNDDIQLHCIPWHPIPIAFQCLQPCSNASFAFQSTSNANGLNFRFVLRSANACTPQSQFEMFAKLITQLASQILVLV